MNDSATSSDSALTRREREVLGLLAEGHSAPEIAQALTLALSTVKFHLDNVYRKLGVNSKRQALTRARALGLLALSPSPGAPPPNRHNLPLQVTRFFGRAEELNLIAERLTEWRLVTVTGPGGVGKTRLALRFAESLADSFAHGAWLVELAPVAHPDLVPRAVATALAIRDQPGRTTRDNLVNHLRERQVLLVMDNCEHLLTATAELAQTLLHACPHLKILATSREALEIAGEAVCPLPPLRFPNPERLPQPESIAEYDAIRLLVDRARAHLPEYQVGEHNAAALARICRRLDGLPLAIEMAAARLNTLSAEQLDARLDNALTVLVNGQRAALPRHQTLQATLDWSYQLLGENLRVLLRRLAVFSDGASLEAVEEICSDAVLPAAQMLGSVAALVARSMVVAVRRPGQASRFRLLETVRQYAFLKLDASGETAELRARHRDYYLALAEANGTKSPVEVPRTPAKLLLSELENIRQALEWSFNDSAHPDAGPRLLAAMMLLWPTHNEGLAWALRGARWCEQHPDVPWAVHYSVLSITSTYTALNDPRRAAEIMERAVAICRAGGADRRLLLMRSLRLLAWRYLRDLDELELARRAQAEAEAIFETLDPGLFSPQEHTFWQAWLTSQRARITLELGDYETARTQASLSLKLFAETGQHATFQHADTQIYQGQAYLELNDFPQAAFHFRQAIHVAVMLADSHGPNRKASALCWLGRAAYRARDLVQAAAYCQSSIRLANEWPDYNLIARNLANAAAIAAAAHQPERAAILAGAAAAMFQRQQRQPRPPWDPATLTDLFADWQDRPDHAAIAAAFEAGQALSNNEAVAFALQSLTQ